MTLIIYPDEILFYGHKHVMEARYKLDLSSCQTLLPDEAPYRRTYHRDPSWSSLWIVKKQTLEGLLRKGHPSLLMRLRYDKQTSILGDPPFEEKDVISGKEREWRHNGVTLDGIRSRMA